MITGVVSTIYNVLRQEANGSDGKIGTKVTENIPVKIPFKEEVVVPKQTLIDTMKAIGAQYDLRFTKDNNWMGTCSPLLALIRSFTYNVQEARLGVGKVHLGNLPSGDRAMSYVSNFGVMPEHHVLGVGMSYPPAFKFNIPSTLGPAAALIMLQRSPPQFQPKYKKVLKRHMSHLPEVDNIIDTIARAKSAAEIRGLVKIVLDILLLTTPRTTNRAFLPIAFWTVEINSTTYAGIAAKNDVFHLRYDFSGLQAVIRFNNATGKIGYRGNDAGVSSEVVFHGVWRTQNENLNILRWMTKHVFRTRAQLGNRFQNKSLNEHYTLALPVIQHFSKLATACQTDLLVQNKQQIHHSIVFAGKRSIQFTQTLMDFMRRDIDEKKK